MTSQKPSRQIGENISENNVEDETYIRLSPVSSVNIEENIGDLASYASETNGIRRSKRVPKANRTEKYGAIMFGLKGQT